MRRIPAVGLTALALIVAVGVGLVAYDAGFDAGLTEFADTTADDVVAGEGDTVVRVIDAGRPGFGPGGFFFFPLALLFWFLVVRLLFWGPWRGGPWDRRRRPGDGAGWPDDAPATRNET